MRPKFIARLGVKAYNDSSKSFQELLLSKSNPRTIEISSKPDDNGLLWTTKVTATLRSDHDLLHGLVSSKSDVWTAFISSARKTFLVVRRLKNKTWSNYPLKFKPKPPYTHQKVLSYSVDCE